MCVFLYGCQLSWNRLQRREGRCGIMFQMSESKSLGVRSAGAVVESIVLCLQQLLSECPAGEERGSVFDLRAAPTISVADYLARMFKYMNASTSTFVYALALIDRLQEENPLFVLHHKNVHRLLLAANVVAAKYLDDFFYKNSFYASVGGLPLKVLNELEAEFMALINFNAHLPDRTFLAYLERLDLFLEVNRTEHHGKENLQAERTPIDRRTELKRKDSNLQPPNAKPPILCRQERERARTDDTRTDASEL